MEYTLDSPRAVVAKHGTAFLWAELVCGFRGNDRTDFSMSY